ncbi:MAG: glycosyltransferase family 4 protein [Anaerolineales bacterium]|jgi:glycosyltransferase involved in cell wall biosynthesis|nr:MAG: glycosyltransferase family 4 protein [Anaerolineales bacterium]
MFDITIYCPDTHILYNAAVPDQKGVGGGLMARIRLAQALTRMGHQVTIIAHVTHRHRHANVDYIPLDNASEKRETDILILISSGGDLSLEPALNIKLNAKWRSIWVQGTPFIRGVDKLAWNEIVPCSNFIHTMINTEWALSEPNCFTIYNGAPYPQVSLFGKLVKRNPCRLIYTSHPSKGLSAAIAVLEKLRSVDKRYHLFVYGGDSMYGGKDSTPDVHSGVTYFGTRRHAEALSALRTSLVSFQLQARPEPFGMVLTESMLHGAIPLASPVGAYPELVSHGQNGILIEGDYASDEAHSLAAEWILRLNQDPQLAAYIRRNAMNIPWDWDTMAKVWAGYWDWALNRKGTLLPGRQGCRRCDGELLALADGYHCIGCGWYYQSLGSLQTETG